MNHKPFIKKFRTESNNYIYDVNTGHFIKVDDTIFDIIEDCNLSPNEILEKHRLRPENLVRDSLSKIEMANRDKGLFKGTRKIQFKHSDPIEILHNKLKSNLSEMNLEITQQCNMRCYYCPYTANYANRRRHNATKMEAEIYKKAIEFFLDHSRDSASSAITFYGGEPLLMFDTIKEIINITNSLTKNVHYGITTNGTLLNKEIADYIIKNDIYLTISLDGPIDIHDRYRKDTKGRGTFETIARNMETIIKTRKSEARPPFSINVTICPPYSIKETMEYFEELCDRTKCMLRVYHVSTYGSELFLSKKAEYSNVYASTVASLRELYINQLLEGDKLSPFLGAFFNQNFRRLHKRGSYSSLESTHYPNGTCFPGLNRLFVDAKGRFYICERMTDFASIGNTFDGFNKEIIFRIFDEYCHLCESNGCSECWAIRLCQVCFVGAKHNNRLDLERMKVTCNMIKDNLSADIASYLQVLEKNEKAFNYFDEEITFERMNNRFVYGKTGIEVK